MRTLSARILLGFAALTVTFGVITATVVFNMQTVENEIQLVRQGYVPLALATKDLASREEDLKAYVWEGLKTEPNPYSVHTNLRNTRNRRNSQMNATRKLLDSLSLLPDFDGKQFGGTRARIDALQAAIAALGPTYDLIAKSDDFEAPEVAAALDELKAGERKIWTQTNELANALGTRVRLTTSALEDSEHRLRIGTIYLGLTAVVLGLLITIWVVITLRPLRRLRDAARQVAAGDYGSRIEEKGPSEVSDLAKEFNSMARAVEERERELVRSERLAAVGKMAAMITHEVRNPLSSIGLNTELLEDELADSTQEARQLCRAIHREVDRLTAITEEYLAFARLPKPKIAAEAINTLVGSLASFVREDLAAKQVELTIELGPGDPIALVDGAQVRQCLINLVRNASDAVAANGGGKITLRTRRAGDRIVIEVEDDGVGIASDLLPRLFDPFFSTKEGGSGLGLALTQQIVKDHGGDLAVESTVGRGTTFVVSVPAAR